MNHKYIDKNTFELIDNVFEVDSEIAESISLLNKKGYYTLYCCSGHLKEPVYYKRVYDISELDGDMPNDFYIVKKDAKKFTLLSTLSANTIYILFDKNYCFSSLPEGFTYNNEMNLLEHKINLYENNIRIKSEFLEEEMIKYNDILLNWVNNLPRRK